MSGSEELHARQDIRGGSGKPSLRPHVPTAGMKEQLDSDQTAGGGKVKRRGSRGFLFPLIVLLIFAGVFIVYRYWHDSAFYVSTDNARVAGALVQVGALNAGRVDSITVDVGSRVERDQPVAYIALPAASGVVQGTPKLGFPGTEELRAEVRSPISGVVVARQASVGDTVAAGQPVVTVVDPTSLWVVANIEETKVTRLQRGQAVEVHVDALDRTLPGYVETITPATAATFSLLPQQNGSGNFTKVTQLVPVKIAVDAQGQTLPLGGSAEVRIRVANPEGWTAWLP